MTNAIAKAAEQPVGNQVIEQYRRIFSEALPTHIKPDTWIRVAQGALRRDEKLAEAAARNPGSLINTLLDAARRGLEPGTEQYYMVPFGSQVQGIVGYQGEIELIYRAGAVSSVIVEVVREHDGFDYRPGIHDKPMHEVDWFTDDRGQLKGVYAYAVMKDGAISRVVVLNRKQVMTHKAVSRGSDRADHPWNKWEESMWLKTAVHELTKWVPTSAEYLRDQARAAGEMMRTAQQPTPAPTTNPPTETTPEKADDSVIDAQVMDPEDWPETAVIGGTK